MIWAATLAPLVPAPPAPTRDPWRLLLTQFLSNYYDVGTSLAARDAPLALHPDLKIARLEDVAPFEHRSEPSPFNGGGRAYATRRILESRGAGVELGNRPVARLVNVTPGEGGARFAFAAAGLHSDLASGEALCAELLTAFWQEAGAGGAGPPHEEADRKALFSRVASKLKVRAALAPNAPALGELSRRVVRLRVEIESAGGAVFLDYRPETALEYARIWALAIGAPVEGDAKTAHGLLAAIGAAGDLAQSPCELAWDLLTCNPVLLVRSAQEFAATAKTVKRYSAGQTGEALARFPLAPSAR